MFIVPMSGITPLESLLSQPKATEGKGGSPASFSDIFKQAIENVEETRKVCDEDSIKVTLGEVDDLHTVQINQEKAATALSVMVAMKTTAIDSYNEIMRMSI